VYYLLSLVECVVSNLLRRPPPTREGTTVGVTNAPSVISTTPMVTTVTSSPSLSPSPVSLHPETSKVAAGGQEHIVITPTSLAATLGGGGQVMVSTSGLSAALQSATQLPTSASFAAMAAAAGLNPGLMASSQFPQGYVTVSASHTGVRNCLSLTQGYVSLCLTHNGTLLSLLTCSPGECCVVC